MPLFGCSSDAIALVSEMAETGTRAGLLSDVLGAISISLLMAVLGAWGLTKGVVHLSLCKILHA